MARLASFVSFCIFLGILRGFLFLTHLFVNPNLTNANTSNPRDLFCSIGIVSFVGDVLFHVTIYNWPLTHWSFVQKIIWGINECCLLSGSILFLLFGMQNKGCCTDACIILFLTDFAFLVLFSFLLLVYGIPFLERRTALVQEHITYGEF
jgi:hypothetical protein